jgi:hypothetical protein
MMFSFDSKRTNRNHSAYSIFDFDSLSPEFVQCLRSAQWIKKYHPEIKIAAGGGFLMELRSLSDARF